MKKLLGVDIDGTATLTPGNPGVGTVTLSGRVFQLNQILVITNVTRNTIIYNFADPDNGATSFSNNVLTLDADTNAYSANDILQVFVDVAGPTNIVANESDDLLRMLSRLVKLMESNAVVDQQQRQRVTLDAIAPSLTLGTVSVVTTVSGVSTVSNVSAQTALAGMDREMWINTSRQVYAQQIRSNLEFS